MVDSELYAPPESFREKAFFKSMEEYKAEYERSISDPDGFWAEKASEYHWFKKWDTVREFNFDLNKGPVFIRWFAGGQTNISYNCLDRHLETRAIRLRSSGRGTSRARIGRSLIASCTRRCAGTRMFSSHAGSRRATGYRSICR